MKSLAVYLRLKKHSIWPLQMKDALLIYLPVCVYILSPSPTLCNPMNCSRQAPLFMRFSRQEYWSGSPFLPPRDFPNPRLKPPPLASPALAGGFFSLVPPGKPVNQLCACRCCSVAQSCWLFVTPWTAARQAFLSLTICQSLHKLMSTVCGKSLNQLCT